MNEPRLSVIIPMRNASATVGSIIAEVLTITEFPLEVIAVDDASADDTAAVVESFDPTRVRLVRMRQHGGAGAARNEGFALARGEYCLFFDADDEISAKALVQAVHLLDCSGADLAFLPYRYRRGQSTDYQGMNSFDEQIWSQHVATHNPQDSKVGRLLELGDVPELLGFSNYPWNKVLRTAHYRSQGLRFSETPVHNDILGHWMTLLAARSLVLSSLPICTHIVEEGAVNLTNHRSSVRLALFDALEETYRYVESNPARRKRYCHHYWDFAIRVMDWAKTKIDIEHTDEFNWHRQGHLLRMNLGDYYTIRQRHNPRLAGRIIQKALA